MAKVLVADDKDYVRSLLTSILELDQHAVRCAGTEDEAVRLYAEFQPDLMVLDVSMDPGEGAQTILARIEALPGGVGCPVLVVTGDAESDSALAVAQHPSVREMLQKPFEIDGLRASVLAAMEP